MSDLPNTDSPTVMALAVAWEIVANARKGIDLTNPEEDIKTITNDVVKVYSALRKISPIND